MAPRRILLPLFAVLVAVAASCSNEPTAPGVDAELLVESVGPLGTAPADLGQPWAWAVNSIDSILFRDDVDSSRIEVTSVRVLDPNGLEVPGTLRYVARNAYIRYTQPFPATTYEFRFGPQVPSVPGRLAKVYFIPSAPLRGRAPYTVVYSTGIRMEKGALLRDTFRWTYTTGDSVAPPFGDGGDGGAIARQ
ncbi:MAG: hypothetical protein ACKO3S_12120 [bacterium]